MADIEPEDIGKQAWDYYHRVWAEWQSRTSDVHRINDKHKWVLFMSSTRSWKVVEEYRLLYVEYDRPWEWQASVGKIFEETLRIEGTDLIWGFGPTDPTNSQNGDYRKLLARSLMGQVFALRPESITMMDNIYQDMMQTRRVQGTQDEEAHWKNLFCSVDTSWQQLWILLACALKTLKQEIVLMLIGFNDHTYETLNEGLQYLNPQYYVTQKNGHSARFAHHKALIIGRLTPHYPKCNLHSDSLASISHKICEDTEISGLVLFHAFFFTLIILCFNRVP
jgi:hypothetical protein